VTIVVFFIWGGRISDFFASTVSALVGAINILMIIFGAVFLYQIMDQKHFIADIQHSLKNIHPDKNFRFFFLAIFLTAFFESVAGFGTPGAIVPLLLIAQGYSPVLSVAVVLLLDGIFAFAGALGTPVQAGLQLPLSLTNYTVEMLYRNSGLLMFFAAIPILFYIYKIVAKEDKNQQFTTPAILSAFILLPMVALAGILKELTGIVASLLMALMCYVLLFKQKKLDWKPWLPYVILVVLLFLPRLFSILLSVQNYKVEIVQIFGTDISTSLQPFKNPLVPFLVAGLSALFIKRSFTVNMKPVLEKTSSVFLVLFPSLVITQLMLNPGIAQFSMIDSQAYVF